jgi:superfamily II DNA or RNA helicase
MESVLAYGFLNDLDMVAEFQSADGGCRNTLIQEVKTKQFLFIKEQLYNLTPVSDWVISIPMGKEHYNQYLTVKKEYKSNHMKNVHQVGKLSVSTSLVDEEIKSKLYWNIETGKIKAIRSIISNLPAADKIVICDNYRETLEYIMRLDFMRALKPLLYVGGAKSDNKKNIESFNNNPERRALLTTRQEGGEGVNLQAANHLILVNCWYTVKDIIQILGRIKRKGQKKPVYTYILGYNLFDCTEPKSEKGLFILEEDEDFYKRIRLKTEMCEEWGIRVETKLPPARIFFNYFTFENEFNAFLENQIIKEPLKITDREFDEEIKKSREEYLDREAKKQAFYDREMEVGESYLMYAYSQYMNKKSKLPLRIPVVRKIHLPKS